MIIEQVKAWPFDDLLAQYKANGEFSSRTQGAYFHELTNRSDAVELLCAKLKIDRTVPDTKDRIDARAKAAHLLGKMGPRAKPAVPLLIAGLENEDSQNRFVTTALTDLGPVAIEAEPELLEELHFQNPLAARALFKIDPESEKVLEAVIERVSDSSMEQGFLYGTIDALNECKVKSDRAKKFLEKIASESTPLAENARRQLESQSWKTHRYVPPVTANDVETNITVLLDRLRSNPEDHPTAFLISKRPASEKSTAVQILLQALEEKRTRFPLNILSALSLFGPEAKPALPILIKYAGEDDSGPANNSLATIGEIGPGAIEAKAVAQDALQDPKPLMQWRAAFTLCLIDPANFDTYIDHLLRALETEQAEYHAYGIRSLGRFGPRAAKAVPMLIKYLDDESEGTSAADALIKIQPDSATKQRVTRSLGKQLTLGTIYTRDAAARLLAEIGPDAHDALPQLREAARSDDAEFAKLAKEAIEKIDAGGKQPL